jgi:MFS family permease
MVPSGLVMVVLAPLSGGIIRSFGGKTALMAGALVMILGYVGRVFFYDSTAWVIIGSTVVGLGTAIAFAAIPTLIMGAVPITETASANGLNSLIRFIGQSTSSAAMAAVFSSVTITVGHTQLPSFDAFKVIFWLAAAASAASMLAAAFIPRATGVPSPPPAAAGAGELAVPPVRVPAPE